MPTTVEEPEKKETSENKKDELLLDSLEIKGYRCFEHLTIEKLGRVNLIVGKNNVGKTALLEALWIYSNNLTNVVENILSSRDEDKGIRFYNRDKDSRPRQRHLFFKRLLADESNPETNFQIGSLYNKENYISFLSNYRNRSDIIFSAGNRHKKRINNEFVETGRLEKLEVNALWDEIESTPREAKVIKALKILLPNIIKVHPKIIKIEGYNIETVVIAQTENEPEPLPLKSYGEGLNRLFEIALTLIKCENGILLIDEIEIGLHYSVLPDVWKLIFKTAKDLNVQVFATTHSKDCIEAFTQAAVDSPDDGELIRLERHGEKIVAKIVDEDRLAQAINHDVEVR